MMCLWLFGLPDEARARSALTNLVGSPVPDGTWILGESSRPYAWLVVHSEPESWMDNVGIEAGAYIEAHFSSARMPEFRQETLVVLRSLRASLGGQIRDDDEVPLD
jgi:hypothetical protein